MTGFAMMRKISPENYENVCQQVKQWFDQNKDRKTCVTSYGEVTRKGYRREINKWTNQVVFKDL